MGVCTLFHPQQKASRWAAGALGIGKGAIAGIAVGLQNAGVAFEQRRGVLAAAPRGVAVHYRRRGGALPRRSPARSASRFLCLASLGQLRYA